MARRLGTAHEGTSIGTSGAGAGGTSGAAGWTEDAQPIAAGAGAAQVRSLLGDYIVPRLTVGALRLFSSDSDEAAPTPESEWLDRLPSRYVYPRHAHDSYELCWVVDGRCVLWLAGRYVLLTPQRACVIQPGEMHHLLPTSKLEPFRTLWCLATPRGVVVDEGTFAQGERFTVGHFVTLPASASVSMAAAAEEVRERRPQHELFGRLRLLEVAALILRAVEEAALTGEGSGDGALPSSERSAAWLVHRLMEHIQGSHGSDATLRHLAAYVGLSPNYATTLFRTHAGRTLMAYVNEVRHRHAAELLRNTDLSVATVAREAGYNDPFYFDRVFRQREGCSPLTYRRLYRARSAAE
jgi:AraC-like DNA-binding protein/mannose-6-phosphate isomerase-like protein (cupin superfamily)